LKLNYHCEHCSTDEYVRVKPKIDEMTMKIIDYNNNPYKELSSFKDKELQEKEIEINYLFKSLSEEKDHQPDIQKNILKEVKAKNNKKENKIKNLKNNNYIKKNF